MAALAVPCHLLAASWSSFFLLISGFFFNIFFIFRFIFVCVSASLYAQVHSAVHVWRPEEGVSPS